MNEGSPFGSAPEDDFPRLEPPAGEPGFGENHAFWLLAEDGSVFINAHLNSVDQFWPLRRESITIALSDGRAVVEMNEGWGTTSDTAASAGIRMRCVEPMRHWRLEYKGTMRETTQDFLAHNALPDGQGRRILVDWDADVFAAAPVLRQGGTAESWERLQRSSASGLIGGARYEQLIRAEVRLRVHGDREFTFEATGTRTHRAGVRKLTEYLRDDWQSARFPSGAGFYLMRFRQDSGALAWEEASLFKDGEAHPAEILTEHWISKRAPSGDRWTIQLRSNFGTAEIESSVVSSIFRGTTIAVDDPAIHMQGPFDRSFGFADSAYRTLVRQQACVRYTLDGESAHGICERSNYGDQYAN